MKPAFNFNWDYWWEEWIKPILIAVVLAFIIRTFIIQPFKIPSNSMYPTLKPGDRIFVSKYIYGARVPLTDIRLPEVRDPEMGDIVVFLSPVEKKKYLVKRYVAGSGQTLEIIEGKLVIDGKIVDSGPLSKFYYYNRGEYGAEGDKIKVPEDSFFVLGDNSANSMDSRYWGFVPDDNLIGKALIVHWPPKRIRLIRDGD